MDLWMKFLNAVSGPSNHIWSEAMTEGKDKLFLTEEV